MPSIAPIYTPTNTHPAYQLNWSLTLFWRQSHPDADWLETLSQATEPDGVRILQHRFLDRDTSQFFISTKPHVAPAELIRSIKGRLQHLVAAQFPKAFQRNFALRSMGAARRDVLEEYIASQVGHHPMADPRSEGILRRYQIRCPEQDLSIPRRTAHGKYWCNLHVVLVNEGRWKEIREDWLETTRETLLKVGRKRGHLLSQAAILCDHIHLALGFDPQQSPMEVALCYMNNLAYAVGMRHAFEFGYYVGTFGEYDRGVVVANPRSTGTGPVGARGTKGRS